MLSFTTIKAKNTGIPKPITELILKMVKDLEDTREQYHGYSYVRTMRNILIGNEDATIAPYFSGKDYYGICDSLELSEVEKMMDEFVKANQLEIIHTEHGKLYCTHEYHKYWCGK